MHAIEKVHIRIGEEPPYISYTYFISLALTQAQVGSASGCVWGKPYTYHKWSIEPCLEVKYTRASNSATVDFYGMH